MCCFGGRGNPATIKWIKKMKILKPAMAGIICLLTCIVLMTGINCIPRELIQKNSEKSAEYFRDTELFHYTHDDFIYSEQDNYADAKWMSIVYAIDPKHPFVSAVWAYYAQKPFENIDDGYYDLVHGQERADVSYSRYWHGTMMLIRPLLVFTDITGIRIIFGIIIVAINLANILLLFRLRGKSLGVCYILAFLSIHPWMFFCCLEYAAIFIVASLAVFSMLILIKNDLTDMAASLFVMAGVLAAFADFLTTETVSFTLPMFFLLVYYMENSMVTDLRSGVCLLLKNGLAWVLGYAGAFAAKQGLVFIICGKDELMEAFAVAAERTYGEVNINNMYSSPVASVFQRLSGAIWHNVAALFYVHAYEMTVQNTIIAAGGVLIAAAIIIYLFRKGTKPCHIVLPILLALVPFVRYLVLSSHSYVHYFFTYRAQIITALVLFYLIVEHGISNVPFMLGLKGKRS